MSERAFTVASLRLLLARWLDTFSYDEAFSRNIGWVTEAEQQALRGKRVAIAGLGGVGGVHFLTLARLGSADSRSPISTASISSTSIARSAPRRRRSADPRSRPLQAWLARSIRNSIFAPSRME